MLYQNYFNSVLWKSPVPAYYSTLAVFDDKIIVATNRGVAAYSIDSGDLVWKYQMSVLFSQYPRKHFPYKNDALP